MRLRFRIKKAEDLLAALLCLPGFLCLFMLSAGCASTRGEYSPFSFDQDTFLYANELTRKYGFDEKGRWRTSKRNPKPAYTHRCFVVARSAKQFFLLAHFDASLDP